MTHDEALEIVARAALRFVAESLEEYRAAYSVLAEAADKDES